MSGGGERDDPFGRGGEEQTDPFGRGLWSGGDPEGERREEEAAPPGEAPPGAGRAAPPAGGWLPPSPAAPPPSSPSAPSPSGGWLPPTDRPPDAGAWWVDREPAPAPHVGGVPTYGRPVAGEAAEWVPRAGAAVLDTLIRIGLVLAAAFVGAIAYAFGQTAGEVGTIVGVSIGVLLYFAYAPWMIATRNGQTIGHAAVNTRVVMADGSPVSGGRAVIREVLVKWLLMETIGGFTFAILTIVNYLWPLWDERKEALHDKICETRVVNA